LRVWSSGCGHLNNWLQAAVRRPVVPPREVPSGGPFVNVVKQRHRGFLQRPGARRLESALAQGLEGLPSRDRKLGRILEPKVPGAQETLVSFHYPVFVFLAVNAVDRISKIPGDLVLIKDDLLVRIGDTVTHRVNVRISHTQFYTFNAKTGQAVYDRLVA